MLFADKVRMLRTRRGLTQQDLAKVIGVSSRTIQNYELGNSMPKKRQTVQRIADYFNVPVSSLLGTEDFYIFDQPAGEPKTDAEKARALMNEVSALFAGGKLSMADRNLMIRTMTDLYLEACSAAGPKQPPKRTRKPRTKRT